MRGLELGGQNKIGSELLQQQADPRSITSYGSAYNISATSELCRQYPEKAQKTQKQPKASNGNAFGLCAKKQRHTKHTNSLGCHSCFCAFCVSLCAGNTTAKPCRA